MNSYADAPLEPLTFESFYSWPLVVCSVAVESASNVGTNGYG